MSVFAPSVSSLWRQIEDLGLDAEAIFKKNGVYQSTLFDTNARVSDLVLDRITFEAAERSGDTCFGVKEAKYFLPSHIGPLGFAWLASTTLQSALERLQRYVRVIHEKGQVSIDYRQDVLVVSVHVDAPSDWAYHRDTSHMAVLTRMCRFVSGDEWNPRLVTIAHPPPEDTAYYFQFFRCAVEFNAEQSSLHIDKVQAEKRLSGSNKQLAKLNDHIVVRYLASQSKGDIINRVKTAILENLGEGSVTETSIAQALHMSTRNLNRKLSAENTSFKAVLLEIRTGLASQYINDATLTLTEISYQLGFSEISSFSRAYKRWTGQSPSQARKEHMGRPSS